MVIADLMRIENRFINYWLPVIAWCLLIFGQSAFATPDIGPPWPFFDKMAHTGIYALLGLLLCRALNTLAGWDARTFRLLVTATLLTALYGLSDEWHQSFVPERHAEAADLLADLLGGLIGSGLFLLIRKIGALRTRRKSFGAG
jgi:VanZ family protein